MALCHSLLFYFFRKEANMAQYGKSFTYDGISSEDFHLVLAGLSIPDTDLGLSRSTEKSTINKYRKQVNVFGTTYDDVLSFTIVLIKDPCTYTDMNDLKFSRQDIREISAWLTSPQFPKLFHMYNYANQTDENSIPLNGWEEYDYFGVFTNVQATDDNIYSLSCDFECNTPFALSPLQTVTIQDEGVVTNESDDHYDYVYPYLIITPTSADQVTIKNNSDLDLNGSAHYMQFTAPDTNPIYIDCRKNTIENDSGVLEFSDLEIDTLDYIYWFRLLYGDNNITVNNAEVTFLFRYPVKVGAY